MDLLTVKRWTLLEIWARTPRVALASFLIFSFAILAASTCWADDASTKAARELAQKIAAQIDRDKKISVDVVDLIGHAQAADLNPIQILIEMELRAHGFHVVTDSSYDTKIRITLSQDSAERLWVADFTADGKPSVMIIPFERSTQT